MITAWLACGELIRVRVCKEIEHESEHDICESGGHGGVRLSEWHIYFPGFG